MEDLEEDQTYRTSVNIYKGSQCIRFVVQRLLYMYIRVLFCVCLGVFLSFNEERFVWFPDPAKLAVDADDSSSDDEGAPRISLAEMLDDLHLMDDDDGGSDGAAGGAQTASGGGVMEV